MVNGSGSCGLRPGTHFQSGVSAVHRCTWASTIMRLRAGVLICASAVLVPAPASASPAPIVPLMKLRRDCIWPSLLPSLGFGEVLGAILPRAACRHNAQWSRCKRARSLILALAQHDAAA